MKVKMSSLEVDRALAQAALARAEKVLRMGSPWPLLAAVDHLLDDHSCDAHGYEGVVAARDSARTILAELPAAAHDVPLLAAALLRYLDREARAAKALGEAAPEMGAIRARHEDVDAFRREHDSLEESAWHRASCLTVGQMHADRAALLGYLTLLALDVGTRLDDMRRERDATLRERNTALDDAATARAQRDAALLQLAQAGDEIERLRAERSDPRRPAQMVPPGAILAEEIEARGWSAQYLADKIRQPLPWVQKLIEGEALLTPEVADALGCALGTPFDFGAPFWMNLERTYRAWKETA